MKKAKPKPLRRIRLPLIKRAYKETGLTPEVGLFFMPAAWNTEEGPTGKLTPAARKANTWRKGTKVKGVACALGALAVYKSITQHLKTASPNDEMNNHNRTEKYLGLDPYYANGFIDGFDGEMYIGPAGTGDWKEAVEMYGKRGAFGVRDGQQARAVLRHRRRK